MKMKKLNRKGDKGAQRGVERRDEIPTFEQLRELFRETRESQKETDRQFQVMNKETDRQFQEIRQEQKETAEQMKETGRRLKEVSERIGIEQAETARTIKEVSGQLGIKRTKADRTMEDLKQTVKRVSEQLGGMGNSNGAFAEDYFASALSEKMMFVGLKFDEVETNMKGKCGAIKDEFDIVMYNGTSVALIEVKYKAQTGNLEQMVEKKVSNFRTLFPYYAGHKVYLGIGSMSFNDHIYAKAKELGIGMLKQKGDTIEADTGYVRAY